MSKPVSNLLIGLAADFVLFIIVIGSFESVHWLLVRVIGVSFFVGAHDALSSATLFFGYAYGLLLVIARLLGFFMTER